MMKRTRRGMALILVLGVLALLSLLAVSFTTLAGVERSISRNYADGVRARLAAQSGIEAAIALLQARAEAGAIWTDRSWSVATKKAIRLDGAEIQDAGFPGAGTYAPDGDLYRVRIEDAQSKLHVNDGLASEAVARNLARILNCLGAQSTVRIPGLGDKILAARPRQGYASVWDVARALEGDREAFERVRPFLTAHAWSDPDVCHPVPLSSETARLHAVDLPRPAAGGGFVYRYGHQKNDRGEPVRMPLRCYDPANPDPGHHRVWGRDSLHPQWIEIVARSPVSLNRASRELLIALITDLEGIFLVERRRGLRSTSRSASPCGSPGGAYDWTALRYRNDEQDEVGGDCGLLYRTLPFTGPGGRSKAGIPAAAVADEIIACRDREASPSMPGLRYGEQPFGGPFGSWAQFNLFVDALVERGLLVDRREELYWDLDAEGRRLPGSPHQLRIASQAIGDVLKANFNPNLHLNELNPNRNLFLLVDKTDLLVNSTEFCLTPMGVFDLESEGRIAAPKDGGLETVALARSAVVVKLFDACRESSQAQFYRGDATVRKRGAETNNNRGVEIGPEPDNGPAPAECRHEGYLQLSTVGSNFAKTDLKPKGELRTTLSDGSFYPGAVTMPPGGAHLGSALHAHFQFDHAAHHSGSRNGTTWPRYWDGFRLPQGAWQSVFGRRGAMNRNWEDRSETLPSPYSPPDATRAGGPGRFRLGRSFSGPPPEGVETASSDLRLDGAYVERDAAFGYWIDENVSFNFNEGTASFWIKPAFTPESTSKRRTLLSLGRYHATAPQVLNPSPFGLFFLPPHDGDDSSPPSYGGGLLKFPSCALGFGFGFSSATGYSWEMGGKDSASDHATSHAFVFSPPLQGRAVFRPHEWTHVAVTWDNPRNELPTVDTVKLYVNGRILRETTGVPHRFEHEGQPFRNTPWWSVHSLQGLFGSAPQPGWVKNTIRLGGEPSRLFDLPGDASAFPGNYCADATFDEFYLWLDRGSWYGGGLWGMRQLWDRGRYYRPDDRDAEDARFTSGPIELGPLPVRTPAPPAARRRILGVSWTELAEDYDRAGTTLRPRMLDYATTPPTPVGPEALIDANGNVGESMADLAVEIEGAQYGPLRNPVFSAARSASGAPVELPEDGVFRYSVKLKRGGAVAPLLLSSPVVDDVTLYHDAGRPRILGWVNP